MKNITLLMLFAVSILFGGICNAALDVFDQGTAKFDSGATGFDTAPAGDQAIVTAEFSAFSYEIAVPSVEHRDWNKDHIALVELKQTDAEVLSPIGLKAICRQRSPCIFRLE